MPWAGKFKDRSGMRSVIAEAVAEHDMYFWHVCLGSPGSLNDIQVLNRSTIISAYMESPAVSIKYTIGDTEFEGAFFLADGIYPNYAYLMKTISEPSTGRENLFAAKRGVGKMWSEPSVGYCLSGIFWNVSPKVCSCQT